MEHNRREHVGQADLDRELGAAENLGGGIDTEPSLAPEHSVGAWVFRLDTIRNRHLFSDLPQLSKIRTLSAGMRHDTRVEFHFRGWDTPRFCGGGNQAAPCL